MAPRYQQLGRAECVQRLPCWPCSARTWLLCQMCCRCINAVAIETGAALPTRRMRVGATLAVAPLTLAQPQATASLQPRSCMLARMASQPPERRLWGQRPLAHVALLSLRCALCIPHVPPSPPLCKILLPAAACAALPGVLKSVSLTALLYSPPALTLDVARASLCCCTPSACHSSKKSSALPPASLRSVT